MNIFVLHTNAQLSATMMCDKHIPRHIKHTAMMMAQALANHGVKETLLPSFYEHATHPCTMWAQQTRSNFQWLAEHGFGLCREYSQRFDGKVHAAQGWILDMRALSEAIPEGELTPFKQHIPPEFEDEDAVKAYRTYYQTYFADYAKWERGTPAPHWWDSNEEVKVIDEREAMFKTLGLGA
jgi:hypothetical protein